MMNYINKKWFSLEIFEQSERDEKNRDIVAEVSYENNGYRFQVKSPRKMSQYHMVFRLDKYNDDFKEVFNLGTGANENNPEQYKKWNRELTFNDLWDRHNCVVYSSLCSGSNRGYLTITDQQISPIKYYKLQSTDQQFWIELYSCFNHESPTKLPKNEGFFIEMQFQPYNKLLYV